MKKILSSLKNSKYLLVILIFLLSCSLEEPYLPSWKQIWVVGFEDFDFIMEEALDDPHFIRDSSDVNNRISISIRDTTDKEIIDPEDFAVDPRTKTEAKDIGVIRLEGSSSATDPISISEIVGQDLTPFISSPNPIPDTVVTLAQNYLLYENFEYAQIDSGALHLFFDNNTFFNIRDSMEVEVYDSTGVILYGEVIFPDPINSMTTGAALPLDLAGTSVTSKVLLQITIPIAGDPSHIITSGDLSGTAIFRGTISDLIIGSASAKAPEFSIQDSIALDEEEHRLIRAEIASGTIDIDIDNPFGTQVNVNVLLDNFYTDASLINKFQDDYVIDPGISSLPTIILDDLFIADSPNPNSNNPLDYFTYSVNMQTDPDSFVTISSDDQITASVTLDTLFLQEFTGILDTVDIKVDPQYEEDIFDGDEFEGTITLDSLRMEIDIFNEIGFNASANFRIVGYKNNEMDSLEVSVNGNPYIDIDVVAGSPLQNNNTPPVIITADNSNILDFMQWLPNSIKIEGSAHIGGDDTPGTVSMNNGIWAEYTISSPLFLSIEEPGVTVESGIDTTHPGEDTREIIENNFQRATLKMNINNGLPVAAGLTIHVSTDSTNLFEDVVTDSINQLIISGIDIPAGTIGIDGYVSSETRRAFRLNLDKEQMKIFTRDTLLYLGAKFVLEPTDGMVKFRSTDKIYTSDGLIELEVMVNNED